MPDEHLLNQLYLFSKTLEIDDALHSLSKVSCIMFTEHFADGIDHINREIGMQFKTMHLYKSSYTPELSDDALTKLKRRLIKEYTLLEKIKSEQSGALNVAIAS